MTDGNPTYEGQRDYEADCAMRPTYHDGGQRKTWAQLGEIERWSWARRALAAGDRQLAEARASAAVDARTASDDPR